MRRTRFLCTAIAPVLVAACAGAPASPTTNAGAPTQKRPNIILITAEDLSPRFGAYGDALAVTPNVDRLAREGITFTRAFTTSGVCAPSRSALITGVHQQTLGTMHMRTSSFGKDMDHGAPYEAVPPAAVKAFPELLRAAGYCTINNPKTDYQFGEPFTVWDKSGRDADWKSCAPGQPVFAMINHEHTHESRTWPPGTDPAIHPSVKAVMQQNARLDQEKTFALTDPSRVRVPAYYPDTPDVRANLARVYDNVRAMDAAVGRLLARLEAEGRFKDSIIIFATDHGDGLPRAKRTVFDSGTHVPLIVRFPDGSGAGSRRGDLVSFVDIAPTILRLAKAPVPRWIQGRNLFGDPAPDAVFAGGDRFDEVTQRFRGVREERWHYIRYFGETPVLPSLVYQNVNPIMREWRRLDAAGGLTAVQRGYLHGPAPREMLFDTAADPDEVTNLAADPRYRAVRDRLARRLDRWIAQTGDLGAIDESAMVARMWPGGVQPQTTEVAACKQSDGHIRLRTATAGASIGWSFAGQGSQLYVTPFTAAQPFDAQAIRYGFKPSASVRFDPATLGVCR